MRSPWLKVHVVLAVAAIALVALPAAASAKAKPTCERSGSKTVAVNSAARLFKRPRNDVLFGCWKKRGRAYSLTAAHRPACWIRGPAELVRLRGQYAAFFIGRSPEVPSGPGCGPRDPHEEYVHAVDLRYGVNNLYRVPSRPAEGRLMLDARGAVAWLSWLRGNQIEIRVIDAIGSFTPGLEHFGRLIDSGAIRPESVSLTEEGELSWDKYDVAGTTYVSATTYLAPFRSFE